MYFSQSRFLHYDFNIVLHPSCFSGVSFSIYSAPIGSKLEGSFHRCELRITDTKIFISAHIFFDDCMEFNDDDEWVPNIFVKQFVRAIDDAARFVTFIFRLPHRYIHDVISMSMMDGVISMSLMVRTFPLILFSRLLIKQRKSFSKKNCSTI